MEEPHTAKQEQQEKQARSDKGTTKPRRQSGEAMADKVYAKNSFKIQATPFESAEEAWFWFIQAQQARNDGARFVSGLGIARPCEPIDFLKIMDRLYRQRRLTMDHFKVLRHYGVRQLAPDRKRMKEMRAWHLWREALNRLTPILERKGIIESTKPTTESWAQEALVYESKQADMFAGVEG